METVIRENQPDDPRRGRPGWSAGGRRQPPRPGPDQRPAPDPQDTVPGPTPPPQPPPPPAARTTRAGPPRPAARRRSGRPRRPAARSTPLTGPTATLRRTRAAR